LDRTMLKIKRAYEVPSAEDGERILVDRFWPRGMSKETLQLAVWLREIAPSGALCKWFGHDPEKWDEFRARYFEELKSRPELVRELLDRAGKGLVTLVFGARDEQHNNAVALKAYLESL